MEYVHKNQGTCSLQTIVDLDGDTIRSVRFVGACGRKSTSCPDQLAQALEEAQARQK